MSPPGNGNIYQGMFTCNDLKAQSAILIQLHFLSDSLNCFSQSSSCPFSVHTQSWLGKWETNTVPLTNQHSASSSTKWVGCNLIGCNINNRVADYTFKYMSVTHSTVQYSTVHYSTAVHVHHMHTDTHARYSTQRCTNGQTHACLHTYTEILSEDLWLL